MTGEDHRLTKQGDVTGLLDSVMASSELPFAAADLAIKEVHPDQRIDELETSLLDSGLPVVDLPLVHRFTPGLYAREIFMPAGTLLTSKIHKTEHPYVVISGRVSVYIPGEGVVHLEAGHVGITKPNTRRVLYIHEDCRWITFHPIAPEEAGDVNMIEARIIERRELADGSTANDRYRALLEEAVSAGLLPAQGETL